MSTFLPADNVFKNISVRGFIYENNAHIGILFMALSAFSFSCGDIVIKVLGENLSPWQISASRGLGGVLVALAIIRFNYRQLLVPIGPGNF